MHTRNESNRLAKECIVTALIELMKTQDYNTITITDLTKKAGVSRMAYYRNYSSKEDIINTFANEVGASIHTKLARMIPAQACTTIFTSCSHSWGHTTILPLLPIAADLAS